MSSATALASACRPAGALRARASGAAWRQHRAGSRAGAAVGAVAALGGSKAHNKYKSRQTLEQEYYAEWERTTKMTDEEKARPMTTLTLLAFLPTWFKFYVVPGPVRFAWFFVWSVLKQAAYMLRKRAVIAGVKLDMTTLQRRGSTAGYQMRATALRRLHGKDSIAGPLRLLLWA